MKEEGLMGGGHRVCEECGETVFGSVIHTCKTKCDMCGNKYEDIRCTHNQHHNLNNPEYCNEANGYKGFTKKSFINDPVSWESPADENKSLCSRCEDYKKSLGCSLTNLSECSGFTPKKTMRDLSTPEAIKKAEEFTEMIKDGTIKNPHTTILKQCCTCKFDLGKTCSKSDLCSSYSHYESKREINKSCSTCKHGKAFSTHNTECIINAGKECYGVTNGWIKWEPKESLKESILNLYKTVTGEQDADYGDIVMEFANLNDDDFDYTDYMNHVRQHYEEQKKPYILDSEFLEALNEIRGKDTPSKERFNDPIGDLMWKGEIKMDKPQFTEEQFEAFLKATHQIQFDDEGITDSDATRERIRYLAKKSGYIIPVKSEEPLIVHNVMSYKGKNYLKQKANDPDSCIGCDFNDDICLKNTKAYPCIKSDYVWKSFDDIQITDELACMRKDIGDIYIIQDSNEVVRLIGVWNGDMLLTGTYMYNVDKCRLATAEELQEYFKEK